MGVGLGNPHAVNADREGAKGRSKKPSGEGAPFILVCEVGAAPSTTGFARTRIYLAYGLADRPKTRPNGPWAALGTPPARPARRRIFFNVPRIVP